MSHLSENTRTRLDCIEGTKAVIDPRTGRVEIDGVDDESAWVDIAHTLAAIHLRNLRTLGDASRLVAMLEQELLTNAERNEYQASDLAERLNRCLVKMALKRGAV